MKTTDYWEKEYLKAKADNVALHKGIRRLKKKQDALEDEVAMLQYAVERMDELLIEHTGKSYQRHVTERVFGDNEVYQCNIKQEPPNA